MAPAKKSYAPLQQDARDADAADAIESLDEGTIVGSAESSHARVHTKRRRWLLWLASHLSCLICGGLAGVLIHVDFPRSTTKVVESEGASASDFPVATKIVDGVVWEGTQCGRSWQEARALGCHFDVMASRWYAPACFDREALDEMLQEPQINYTWFADPAHTIPLHPDTAMAGEFDKIYPLTDFHIGHCLYLWRRLHRAVLHNRPLDDELFSYGHTVHCTRLILRWKDPWDTVTFQTSGRPFCRHNRLGYVNSS